MKKKQFESLCKSLLPYLPGFDCKGWLLYARPVGHILRGFCCDDSGFDPQKFAVTVFFLPLYVPTKHIHFNMGQRLKDERGCDIWWSLSDPRLCDELLACIERQGLPFLDGVKQPCDVVTAIQRLGPGRDPYRFEAVAYSHVLASDFQQTTASMNRLLGILDTGIGWQAEMYNRAKGLLTTLESEPNKARLTLERWERETIENLGLGNAS